MTTPENLTAEEVQDVIDKENCSPECVSFLISVSHCYCEWSTVIGLSLMLAGSLILFQESEGNKVVGVMMGLGLFGAVTGCISGCISDSIDDNRVEETDNVTFEV